MNTIITVVAFRETYRGLKAAISDLRMFAAAEPDTQIQAWVLSRNYEQNAVFRNVILGMTWLILGYLLIYPVLW